jgi:flavin-binding protein dodecin
MPDHVYKVIEIVGSSRLSSDDAIRRAIEKASTSVRHINWFQVIETRGHIADGKVAHSSLVATLDATPEGRAQIPPASSSTAVEKSVSRGFFSFLKKKI